MCEKQPLTLEGKLLSTIWCETFVLQDICSNATCTGTIGPLNRTYSALPTHAYPSVIAGTSHILYEEVSMPDLKLVAIHFTLDLHYMLRNAGLPATAFWRRVAMLLVK